MQTTGIAAVFLVGLVIGLFVGYWFGDYTEGKEVKRFYKERYGNAKGTGKNKRNKIDGEN